MRNADTGHPSPTAPETAEATAYVYLVHHPESGAYKIGRSADPQSRLNQLAPKSAGLVLVATVPTADPVWLEWGLHMAFAHRRVKGEWFLLSGDEAALIASIPRADTEADIPPPIVDSFVTNKGRDFVSDCAGACVVPGRPKDEAKVPIAFNCPADTANALDDYLASIPEEMRPTKRGILIVAIRNYLASKGAWPPPSPPK